VVCEPIRAAADEVCDGIDNDCDGEVDEEFPEAGEACETDSSGACTAGALACEAGSLTCVQTAAVSSEICDGIDNDCDGEVDEEFPEAGEACETGLEGACAEGEIACASGELTCLQTATVSGEVCDGIDNDCDGEVDDTFPELEDACDTGLEGVCAVGSIVCDQGILECEQTAQPTEEVCDSNDNDCDGDTDESYPESGEDCDTGLEGACAPGTYSCDSGSLECHSNASPTEEICDGLDNDCNGVADADAAGEVDEDDDGVLSCADCDDNNAAVDECASNVILMIADGMGFEQIKATRMYLSGDQEPLLFEKLPYTGTVTDNLTYDGGVTDSAAAGTAMATGHKVHEGVVSVASPGDGAPLTTALEIQQARGKWAGLVTIVDSVVSATPATFGAHALDRDRTADIAQSLLDGSRPNVLLGGQDPGLSATAFSNAGYTVVQTVTALNAVEADSVQYLLGMFPDEPEPGNEPDLPTRTDTALDILEESAKGFFLLIEHEGPDQGGHQGDLGMVIDAMVEFQAAVERVLAWANDREDTLVVVLSDHETGGLDVLDATSPAGVVPNHEFTAPWVDPEYQHTDRPVPVYAQGPDADYVTGLESNTEVFDLLAGYVEG
jgi:alkaline phosphatase